MSQRFCNVGVFLALLLSATSAQAQLGDADRARIVELVEEFRAAVESHDREGLEACLSSGMPLTRRTELLDKIGGATQGYSLEYQLSASTQNVSERAGGEAVVAAKHSMSAQSGGSHWNFSGLRCRFTVEKDGGTWKIKATNTDEDFGFGAVMKLVLGILGILFGVLAVIVVGAVLLVVYLRRRRAAGETGDDADPARQL